MPAGLAVESGDASDNAELPPAPVDRQLVRSADLALRVTDIEEALVSIRRIAADAGGAVFASSVTSDDIQTWGSITIDVPAQQFDDVVSDLRRMPAVAEVVSESVSSEDVTAEYVDLEARLRNLQATEARFLSLVDQAAALDDVLTVENQLTRVRGEIEQVEGRMRYLDQRTVLSRIVISLEVLPAVESADAGSAFDAAATVRTAWNLSLYFIGQALGAVITVVVFLWWLIPLGALGWSGYVLIRWRRRKPAGGETSGGVAS